MSSPPGNSQRHVKAETRGVDGTWMQIDRCRSCGNIGLRTVLELGSVPLANALLDKPDDAAARFPLTLAFCPTCTLVQILETVDPTILFAHYLYFSSFSESMVEHARQFAERMVRDRLERSGTEDPPPLVVELASNDGYLLKHFVERGFRVLGIEPAQNIAAAAREAGIPTLNEFFGVAVAERLASEGVAADLVVGNNVLAHVADLNGFVAGAARLLRNPERGASGGRVSFEAPYVRDMIEHVEFDTIYHEHLCYFSAHAVRTLFERHGLTLVDAERLTVHGGSVRYTGARTREAMPISASVRTLLAEERDGGLTSVGYYSAFGQEAQRVCRELREELDRRKRGGQRLAAYGASAKGSTLMNVAGIGRERLEFIADLSTAKQGKFAPGNALEIVSPTRLMNSDGTRAVDAVVLLAWNWAEEIARQQRAFLEAGGEMIVPVPHVRTINARTCSGARA